MRWVIKCLFMPLYRAWVYLYTPYRVGGLVCVEKDGTEACSIRSDKSGDRTEVRSIRWHGDRTEACNVPIRSNDVPSKILAQTSIHFLHYVLVWFWYSESRMVVHELGHENAPNREYYHRYVLHNQGLCQGFVGRAFPPSIRRFGRLWYHS